MTKNARNLISPFVTNFQNIVQLPFDGKEGGRDELIDDWFADLNKLDLDPEKRKFTDPAVGSAGIRDRTWTYDCDDENYHVYIHVRSTLGEKTQFSITEDPSN